MQKKMSQLPFKLFRNENVLGILQLLIWRTVERRGNLQTATCDQLKKERGQLKYHSQISGVL